jgi:hypothetical protein
MSVEVIDHKASLDDLWEAFHAALDMPHEIGLFARAATGNPGDLARGHLSCARLCQAGIEDCRSAFRTRLKTIGHSAPSHLSMALDFGGVHSLAYVR